MNNWDGRFLVKRAVKSAYTPKELPVCTIYAGVK